MTSWRSNASTEAQEALDDLLNAILGFAVSQLDTTGAFFPFASAVLLNREIEMVAPSPDDLVPEPTATDVLAGCWRVLRSRRNDFGAAGVASDVALPGGIDAIQVDLEHSDGIALVVQLPYERAKRGRIPEYGQIRANNGHPKIWV